MASIAGKDISITFEVLVPPETDKVTIVGNVIELGNWNPGLIPMNRVGRNKFSITILLKKRTVIEYKFTRGSWDNEAMLPDSTIPGNHRLKVKKAKTVTYKIPFWKDELFQSRSSITGNSELIEEFYSPELDNHRNLIIWLPPSYDLDLEKHYPVLYIHDGQNAFNPGTSFAGKDWELDETVTRLINKWSHGRNHHGWYR